MTIGFDEPRPKKQNYIDFEKKLVDSISKLNIEGFSLMFYGSYARKNATYGRSDIDGIVIFNDDVIINKKNLLDVSDSIAYALEGNNVPLQFTATDLRTMKDGTFNTYDTSYIDGIEKDGIIVYGPDYRKDFKYIDPYLRQHPSLRHNIRKSRTNLLMSSHNSKNDHVFIEKFNKSLDAMVNCSKQIILLTNPVQFHDGRDKFSTYREIELKYPNVDMSPLYNISYYLKGNIHELDKLYRNKPEAIKLWSEGLTTMEHIVKSYLDLEIKINSKEDSNFNKKQLDIQKKFIEENMYPHNLLPGRDIDYIN